MAVDTIPRKVLDNGVRMADRPAYYIRTVDGWQPTTWSRYADEVRTVGKSLIALGLEEGQAVNILGFNRPEWVITHVAAMAVGGVPAGIYTTNSPTECSYIVGHCEAPVILLEDESQWEKIKKVRGELPNLRHAVMMQAAPEIADDMVLSWDEFIVKGEGVSDQDFESRLDALAADQLGTLIYTSGTTGPPKGVMLSHDNLIWTGAQAIGPLGLTAADSAVSYLPLSHIAEQSFSIHLAAQLGYAVYYAESIEKLADNLKEVQPTLFFAVPRVWERFYAGVTAQLGHATGIKKRIADWAQSIGRKVNDLRMRGEEPAGMLTFQYQLAERLVFAKVKAALGMSNARIAAVGAAPVSKEILEFFAGLDLPVVEVYGQSEDTGPTSTNLPGATRLGSVGKAWPGVEVKIADDGEILVKGRNVFMGYYKDPEATADTLIDGWLHSGDLGEFDGDGYLWITGRKKDIIITAGGKNVAPKPLESGMKNHHLVSEAVVIGDRRKFLSAVITVDEDAYAASGMSGPAHESPELRSEIQSAIDDLNSHFARVEQIKKFTILPRQLSIEGGELTPTLKVKRSKVAEHFAVDIEAMYAE